MLLRPNGLDVFYVDESERHPLSVATLIRVPFLRQVAGGWRFVWDDYLQQATNWRRALSRDHAIKFRHELHGTTFMRSQGLYHRSGRNLTPDEAVDAYKAALSTLTFLPAASIMSTFATNRSTLMGEHGVGACLLALFQRIRSHCEATNVNGMIFFDEGHESYIRRYRKAQKYLPTGSRYWPGQTRNLPLDMFPKDANIKQSHMSYFVQMADLVVYAARVKLEYERGVLNAKRERRGHHQVYDALPVAQINTAATRRRQDGIVPT